MSAVFAGTDRRSATPAIGEQPRGDCWGRSSSASASAMARAIASRATSSGSATSAGTGTHRRAPLPRPIPRCVATMRAADQRRPRPPVSLTPTNGRSWRPQPDRRRSWARHGSPGTRASRARRGSPSGRRTDGRSASDQPRGVRDVDVERGRRPHPSRPAPRDALRRPLPSRRPSTPAAAADDHRCGNAAPGQPPSARATARLGRAAFLTEPFGAVASASSATSSRRRADRPARTATVAGTAPGISRTAASEAAATSRFCGYGRPWLMSVDSSATTGRPRRRRCRPSGAMTSRSARTVRRTYPKPTGAATLSLMPRRPMTPDDIRAIVVVEELDLSVDGRTAVVVRRSIKGNHYLALPVGDRRGVGAPCRRLASDPRHHVPRHQAAHLPGRDHVDTILGLRTADDDSVAAIGLLDLDDPSASGWRASVHTAASPNIAWSPDGRRLAFTAEVDPPRFITGRTRPVSRRGTSKGADGAGGAARPAHHPLGLAMGRGGSPRPLGAPVHLDTPGGRPRQVTQVVTGRRRYRLASRPPQSTAFSSDRGSRPTFTLGRPSGPSTSTTPTVTRTKFFAGGWATRPAWSPRRHMDRGPGILEVSRSTTSARDPARPGRCLALLHRVRSDLDRPMATDRFRPDAAGSSTAATACSGPTISASSRSIFIAVGRIRGCSRWAATGRGVECRALGSTDGVTHFIRGRRRLRSRCSAPIQAPAMELMTVGIDHGTTRAPHAARHRVALATGVRDAQTRLVQAPGDVPAQSTC